MKSEMMSTDQPIQPTKVIEPFSLQAVLVGLEIGKTDSTVLKYLHFLSTKINVEQWYFLHHLEALKMFESLYREGYISMLNPEAMELATKERMNEIVTPLLKPLNKPHFIVTKDQSTALIELLRNQQSLKADLVVVGQKTGSGPHSILAKRFIRKVPSNALLVPSKSRPKLTRILVPIDFSEYSIKAIESAIAINKCLADPVPITCLNVFEVPDMNWYRIQRSEQEMRKRLTDDRIKAFNKIREKRFPIYGGNVQFKIIYKEKPGTAKYILDFALKDGYDLIIVGAKGHSTFEQILIGSVTERLASLTQSIPLLIIR